MPAFNGLELSPWYLNTRRLNPMCGNRIPAVAQTSIAKNTAERAQAMAMAYSAANSIVTSGNIASIVNIFGDLTEEEYRLCYIWGTFNFRKVGAAISQERAGGAVEPASFNAKLSINGREVAAQGILSNDHVYSSTSSLMMSGRKRALMIAQVCLSEQGDIDIHPIIIGDMVINTGFGFTMSWKDKFRIHPEDVDSFAEMKGQKRPSAKNVGEMLNISEEEVKFAIADIIGEPFVPKDWGGEKSDLNTNHLMVRGELK